MPGLVGTTVLILCISKVVQVSNGFSLLDPDVSTGLRVRKWLLMGLAVANGMRCIASTVEFIIFSIKVVKNDQPTSSISYYDGFQQAIPFTIFICRVFPTVLFLACYGTMALYVSELYYSVREQKFSSIRTFWVAINLLFLVAFVQYLVISSDPRILNIIGLVAVIIYSLWISWFAYALHGYFFHANESSSATFLSGPSVGQRKVFARLEVMVCVGLTALLSYAVDNALDIGGAFNSRSFFLQSTVDLLTIFYSEVLCAWFYVSLLSNNLVTVEAKIQTLLVTLLQQASTEQGQGQGQSLTTGSNSNNKLSNSGGGYGRGGGIGASSSLLASSHNNNTAVGGIKSLQQQQKQYKNYQSISMDESLP